MNDDDDDSSLSDSSLSGRSETVHGERELVQSGYSSQDFIQDPDDIFRYSLLLYPQKEPFYISAKLNFDTRPPYPYTPLECTVENNRLGLKTEHLMGGQGMSEHQLKELQDQATKCCEKAQRGRAPAAVKVINVVKLYLYENNKRSYSLHHDMEESASKSPKMESFLVSIHDKICEKKYPPCMKPGAKLVLSKPTFSMNSNSSSPYNLTCLSELSDKGTFNAFDRESCKQYLIHEYIMDLSVVKLKGELENIQKDFSRTQKLNHHVSILKYLALDCPLSLVSNVVHVLTPEAWPLFSFTLPYSNCKQLAKELISGLQFLHNQDILHGFLTLDSVYLSRQGHHLIGDYGFAKTLLKASTKRPFKKFSLKYSDSVVETGRHLDVLLLGHVIYHACIGRQPDSAYPALPSYLDPLLLTFIKECTTKDKKLRPTLDSLESHEYIGLMNLYISDNIEEPKITFSAEDVETNEPSDDGSEQVWRKSNRLKNEYDVKEILGSGGFGSVIKVRNKIDGSFYAMKVVQLSRNSINAIEQMRKEVKLLSQLKHHNIVRYNSTFIEKMSVRDDSVSDKSTTISKQQVSSSSSMESFDFGDAVDEPLFELSFQQSTAEIRSRYHEGSSDDESSSESSPARSTNGHDHDSQSVDIVFEYSCKQSTVETSRASETSLSPNSHVIVMFIQMEFCENTTLRTLMRKSRDPPLHKNIDLLLKLLRQIVDALEYIHLMNIIHRDLKPENIFLDSKNNVKIGDFGLAVSGCYGKGGFGSVVGTSVYIAPEVRTQRKYTPLVDIYSLGVICFEMAAGPFTTRTERAMVLTDLREPSITIPAGTFSGEKFLKLEALVRAMLSHNVKIRPTASAIADTDILPPRLAEQGLQEILRHINSEQGSERKEQFINSLFSNDIANGSLLLYDSYDTPDTQAQTLLFTRTMNDIIERMMAIFLRHGAVQCPLPFLLPKCDLSDRQDRPFVVLSKAGYYQVLPCNLKLNLAKHVLKNNISNLKRYGFTQVFRKRVDKAKKNPNPRDILEGCFDIISTGPPAIAKAEVFIALLDVMKEIPEFKKTNVTIYFNHTKIMKAILLFYKIDEIYHYEILKLIYDFAQNYTKLEERLQVVCDSFNERQVKSFLTLLKYEGPINEIHRQPIIKAIIYKSSGGQLFKEGLKELLQVLLMVVSDDPADTENIMDPEKKFEELADELSEVQSHASTDLGQFKIRPGTLNDPYCYNDFTFQVVHKPDIDSKIMTVIGVGGDFGLLLNQWNAISPEETALHPLPSAFGVNFLLEDMANILSSPYRAKIVIVSDSQEEKELLKIFWFMKQLWERSIRTEHILTDVEDTECAATHRVEFSAGEITIYSDPSYIKAVYDWQENPISPKFIYQKTRTVMKRFHLSSLDEALKYLVDIEATNDELEMNKKNAQPRRKEKYAEEKYAEEK